MAKNGKVLSIDITNESITIIEISASPKKQTNIHNVIIFETPEDSYEDGVIKAPDRIAGAIRTQLSSKGITNKNAVFVLSSTKIVNREVLIQDVKEKDIRGIINANASEYFPVNIEDYVVSHSVLEKVIDESNERKIRVLAVAAPANMVRAYYELGSMCGLTVESLDYIGNAMLELIKTQTVADTTTMVVQLGSEATVLNIVQGENLLLQRTVPYGTNSVVNVVMNERGVDATTSMTLLQNEKLITADFSDNDATGAFRYLINNIGRVMDYYATKNPTRPIEDICLTGDGALIKGIDGLFKVQLNVNTRIMDSLINMRFDPSIDLKVYNPVYLVTPIGAALNPMGFELATGKKSSGGSSGPSIIPFVAIFAVAAVGAAALAFTGINKLDASKTEKQEIEDDIKRLEPIKLVIEERDRSYEIRNDVTTMCATTYQLNENARDFITNLETKIPKEISITGFTSSNEGVNIPAYSYSYDAIADFIIQLKTIDCIDDAYVATIVPEEDESGEKIYKFTVTAVFVDNNTYVVEEVEEAAVEDTAAEETENTEAQ